MTKMVKRHNWMERTTKKRTKEKETKQKKVVLVFAEMESRRKEGMVELVHLTLPTKM